MRKIEAIIRPQALHAVRRALHAIGVTGITAIEVKGVGRQKGQTGMYRTAEFRVDFVPKVKLEVVVGEELVEPAIGAIREAANDGRIGAGKIFCYALDEVVRIRTGERGPQAI